MIGTVFAINAGGEKMEAWVSGKGDVLAQLMEVMPEGWHVRKMMSMSLEDFYEKPLRDLPIIIYKSKVGKKAVYRMVT